MIPRRRVVAALLTATALAAAVLGTAVPAAAGSAAWGAAGPTAAGSTAGDLTGDSEPFTLAVLPDTQRSADGTGETFHAQTTWLAENADRLRLAFVLHEGDLVDEVCEPTQWQVASDAMGTLEAARIPYAISPGNHDLIRYGACGDRVFSPGEYDASFPLARAAAVAGFGGSFDDTALNTYYTFSAAGRDHLVLALQFGPTAAQAEWARDVAAVHPEHRTILLTHDLIGNDGLLRGGDSATVAALPSLPGQLTGAEIWETVVEPNDNVVLTLNGHVSSCQGGAPDCNSTTGTVARSTVGGVHRLLANYQSLSVPGAAWGDGGFVRLITVHPDQDVLQVQTYSPSLDRYLTDPGNRFLLTAGHLAPFPDPGAFPTETGQAHRQGLVTGYQDGTLRPLASITRQAAAALVYRALPGARAGSLTCTEHDVRSPFPDVADDHPFCFAIRELVLSGQVSGYPDGTFRPARSVTREAFTAFMFDRTVPPSYGPAEASDRFTDVPVGAALGPAIASASEAGVVTGYAGAVFRPGATITRQAAAAMIVRYYYHQRSVL